MFIEINSDSADLPYFSFLFEDLSIFIDFKKMRYFRIREDSDIQIRDESDVQEEPDVVQLWKDEWKEYSPYFQKFIFDDDTYLYLYSNCGEYYIRYDCKSTSISKKLNKSNFTLASSRLSHTFTHFKMSETKSTGKYTYDELCVYKGIFETEVCKGSIIYYNADVWDYIKD